MNLRRLYRWRGEIQLLALALLWGLLVWSHTLLRQSHQNVDRLLQAQAHSLDGVVMRLFEEGWSNVVPVVFVTKGGKNFMVKFSGTNAVVVEVGDVRFGGALADPEHEKPL